MSLIGVMQAHDDDLRATLNGRLSGDRRIVTVMSLTGAMHAERYHEHPRTSQWSLTGIMQAHDGVSRVTLNGWPSQEQRNMTQMSITGAMRARDLDPLSMLHEERLEDQPRN